jgi:hypothetical protein
VLNPTDDRGGWKVAQVVVIARNVISERRNLGKSHLA